MTGPAIAFTVPSRGPTVLAEVGVVDAHGPGGSSGIDQVRIISAEHSPKSPSVRSRTERNTGVLDGG